MGVKSERIARGRYYLERWGVVMRARRDGQVCERPGPPDRGRYGDLPSGEHDLRKYMRGSRPTDRSIDDPPPGSTGVSQVDAAIAAMAKAFALTRWRSESQAAARAVGAAAVEESLRALCSHVFVDQLPPVAWPPAAGIRQAATALALGDRWVSSFLEGRVDDVALLIGTMVEGG